MRSPRPYNITIPSQCPNFQFYPARDGPIDQGWNVTYSGSSDTKWAFGPDTGSVVHRDLGHGTSSHRTSFSGAYVELDWTGTAIYVYGTAGATSVYGVLVDSTPAHSITDPSQGILGGATGLVYGQHKLHVWTGNDQLFSFQGVVLTVGLGFEGDSTKNHTVVAAILDGSSYIPNPLLRFNKGWWPGGRDTVEATNGAELTLTPQIVSFSDGDSFSLQLNQTSAFFLHGTMRSDRGSFMVSIRLPDLEVLKSLQLNHSSHWYEMQALLYFETGLDPGREYQVIFQNVGVNKAFSVRKLEFIQVTSRHSLSTAALAGISTSVVLVIAFIVCALFLISRCRRRAVAVPSKDLHTTTALIPEPLVLPIVSPISLKSRAPLLLPSVVQGRETGGSSNLNDAPPDYDSTWPAK